MQLELKKRYKDSQICSVYVCRMTMSKISTLDGIIFFCKRCAFGVPIWVQGGRVCVKVRNSGGAGANHLVAEAKCDRERVNETDFSARRGRL